MCHVLDAKADEKMVSVLLSIMLDGFPRGMIPERPDLCRRGSPGARRDCSLGPNPRRRHCSHLGKDRFPPTIADLLDEFERARQAR
ncbi:hypothetical protein [Methylocystis iwaonis]|uniref:hypothetical protein n=1 Tax=Methylocystis iwaonis TaxID=2885079 RepID=UPI002490A090|nr:hypothetical protein [Methylocystis iwaonis]